VPPEGDIPAPSPAPAEEVYQHGPSTPALGDDDGLLLDLLKYFSGFISQITDRQYW
jgi:hypothetical protein